MFVYMLTHAPYKFRAIMYYVVHNPAASKKKADNVEEEEDDSPEIHHHHYYPHTHVAPSVQAIPSSPSIKHVKSVQVTYSDGSQHVFP